MNLLRGAVELAILALIHQPRLPELSRLFCPPLVQGSGVWGWGLGVGGGGGEGLSFWVQGLGLRVWGLGLRVWGLGLRV